MSTEEFNKSVNQEVARLILAGEEKANAKYELTFFGAATANYFPSSYKRFHPSAESVRLTIDSVYRRLGAAGLPTICHPAVVYSGGKQVSL